MAKQQNVARVAIKKNLFIMAIGIQSQKNITYDINRK